LGTVYVGSVIVGSFLPDVEGTSGSIYLDGVLVGSFTPLTATGFVYVHLVTVGTYTLAGGGGGAGVGVGPTDLIYLEKLYEIRVHIGGGANWNYTRFGLKDGLWIEDDPWVEISILQGTPKNQHMEIRTVRDGRIICLDDKAVYTLFRNTDVSPVSGNQYLLADTSYAATKVVFVYKGTRVIVATGNESEYTVYYTFTNFRVGKARSNIDMENQHYWEISFKADSVERSEP